jgi:hypothetical protein
VKSRTQTLATPSIFEADDSDASEAHNAVLIQPGETIHASDGRKLLVLEVTPTPRGRRSPTRSSLRARGGGG